LKRLLVIWSTINVIVPVCVLLSFFVTDLEPHYQSWIVYLTVLIVFSANVIAAIRSETVRWTFAAMLLLNPLALIMLGSISFVTAIPDLVMFVGH
jgi:hypothetical protein